ncbi:hypothetical protein [Treponema sp. Marseille-Q4523]|jgi:hypothetical protein|uniref:hypothetical protein n=1 Tax=Treponema sp. Marseille-Q4523 TaxID=2810610 RepID=UPI00195F31B7|nr:hypothetical protein [Treponema sp. Marseille-Q4523]MBM7022634.1 hypothetical protein [Treponema sp. Marseille-Q4523]
MTYCKKILLPLCLSLFLFSSCATLDNWTYRNNTGGEDTAEEKAIEYPYDVYVMHHLRLVKLTFLDRSHLKVTYPGNILDGEYEYQLLRTLYSWKRGYADMQLCGVQLKVVRLKDKFGDWIEICRKGDFTKAISHPHDYFQESCKNRYIMKTFFEQHMTARNFEDEYDFHYNAIPNITFQNWEERLRYERERKREHLKYTRRW